MRSLRFIDFKTPGLLDVGCGPDERPENLNLDYHWRPSIEARIRDHGAAHPSNPGELVGCAVVLRS
jgi:hypothetical protein